MSNAICIQDQCETFLMYNKTENGMGYPAQEIYIAPFIKEICKTGDEYTVSNYNLDGSPYEDAIGEEITPSDISFHTVPVCVQGVQYLRWYVSAKSKLLDSKFYFHTNFDGGITTVATNAQITFGECGSGDTCQTHPIYNYSPVMKFVEVLFEKRCPSPSGSNSYEITYTDINGNIKNPASTPGGLLLLPEDLAVHQQVMCDGNKTFIRWHTTNKGVPAFFFDTDLEGGVIDDVTGTVTVGSCEAVEQCETEKFYQLVSDPEVPSGKTLTPFLKKQCPGEEPVYYDVDGNELESSTITGEVLFPEDVDVEHEVMCDGTTTFIRWYVAIGGKHSFFSDTTLDGVAIENVTGDITVGDCATRCCPCETERYYQLDNQTLSPFLKKVCPGEEPVYTDLTGQEIDTPPSDRIYYPEDVNVQQQFMCDGEDTFIRWHTAVRGGPSSIFYDTDLDGVLRDPPEDSSTITAGVCPDCTETKYELLCDVDRSTVRYIPSDYPGNNEMSTYEGVLDSGTTWRTVAQIQTERFRFNDAMTWEFSDPVNAEFTFLQPYSGDACVEFNRPVRLKGTPEGATYTASPNRLCVSNPAGTERTATIIVENITDITFSADDTWFVEDVTVYSPIPRDPIQFRQKTVIDCEGAETKSYVDDAGDEYVPTGTIESCS